MTIDHVAAILHSHSVDTAIIDGRLYAETSYTREGAVYDEWIDVTEFSAGQVYGWLGY